MQFVTIKYANASFILRLERIRKRRIQPSCCCAAHHANANGNVMCKGFEKYEEQTELYYICSTCKGSSCKVVCCFPCLAKVWLGRKEANSRGFTFTVLGSLLLAISCICKRSNVFIFDVVVLFQRNKTIRLSRLPVRTNPE